MNKLIVMLLVTLMSVTSNNLFAQSGPIVPCVNCEQYSATTEPFNGLWYNPEQSGVGYSIEIQNGLVFGVYYGYDQNQKPMWLTFLGYLQVSDNSEIMWTLDANLKQFEGGTCLNCNYQLPSTTDFKSTIHIDFKQKNYASFSVNDGVVQNIIPIVYGVTSDQDFPDQTSYRLPDLYGMWSFVIKFNPEISQSYFNQWGYKSIMLSISHKSGLLDLDNDGNMEIIYAVSAYTNPPEVLIVGLIICETLDQENNTIGPICTYEDNFGLFDGEVKKFNFSLGGLGASRLFGETIDGHTFEAFKVDSKEYQSR